MPPTDGDKAFRWRLEDSYRTVTGEAFAKLVHENGLEPKGPFQGYWYAMMHTTEGEELYRTLSGHKWIYQARRVLTQDNAGGGALSVRFSLAAGQIGRLISLRMIGTASAGATLEIDTYDEDGQVSSVWASQTAGATRNCNLPSIGTAASGAANQVHTLGHLIAPGESVVCTSSVALQTETLTVAVKLELFNISTLPTWATTGSAGTPTLAASTISDANTLQEVLC